VITATGIELRAGARVLIESASFRVAKGDRIGLVGRNGAGKTTLTKVLAGEGIPAAGTVTRSGEVGYLPQDPRTGDLDILARDRILSARGLDVLLRKMRENEERIASGKGATREKAMKQYERQETEFLTKGGYAAEAEAATIAAALNLPDCTRSPAVSAAASSWPASSSRTRTPCCSTSPPTTSTPTRSSGCGTT
jgi:ATPase subunit of ABC transporter with duplicated ATPase domains